MVINKTKIAMLICILFALDSFVKLSLPGFRIHPSHLLIILSIFFIFIKKEGRVELIGFARENLILLLFFMFCIFQFIQAESLRQYLFVFSYLLIMFLTYFYFYANRKLFSMEKVFINLTIVILFGGIVQYLLHALFGYQLALGGIDSSYYLKGSSVDSRMRGFFLEPNWFGLSLTFSFIGYALTIKKISRASVLLILMVVICSLLSGNRLSNYFVFLTIIILAFARKLPYGYIVSIAILGLMPAIFFFMSLDLLGGVEVEDRSLTARTITAARVINYASEDMTWYNLLLGHGLSSWYGVALDNHLTIRSGLLEDGKALRDTSETYVLFIEHGFLGCGLLVLDLVYFARRSFRRNRQAAPYALIATTFLFSSAFYYPIFFFMMYLIPYFLIRIFFIETMSVRK